MRDKIVLVAVHATYLALGIIGFVIPAYVLAHVATLPSDVYGLQDDATLLIATTRTQVIAALTVAWFSGAAGIFMAAWAAVTFSRNPS